jgi:hypothetical protein
VVSRELVIPFEYPVASMLHASTQNRTNAQHWEEKWITVLEVVYNRCQDDVQHWHPVVASYLEICSVLMLLLIQPYLVDKNAIVF